MSRVAAPPLLRAAVAEDRREPRRAWLDALPALVEAAAAEWSLVVGEPYRPGGRVAWVAPARGRDGAELALKVSWRHPEAEHEAAALALWDGDGAVRCLRSRSDGDASILLLERCVPGAQLGRTLPGPEQDVVIAGLLRRLWAHAPPAGGPFATLQAMCDDWAAADAAALATGAAAGADPGLVRAGLALLRALPASAGVAVLLATDLHGENVLSAAREPWLAIDPKPFVGDPAYDAVQHMLNAGERLAADPAGLAARMADLLEVDRERVRLWLFARCAQESARDPAMRAPARRLAP